MRQNVVGRSAYVWQRPDWTAFSWNAGRVLSALGEARLRQGILAGAFLGAVASERFTAHATAIAEEAIDTFEIEGETLDDDAVRSSVARRLGLLEGGFGPADARADGVVAITLDATQHYAEKVSVERLHEWHAELFPLEREKGGRGAIGRWRDDGAGPMLEAPPAQRVAAEIDRCLRWFNAEHAMDGLIRAAQAHLWFVTVHPYDDGNGSIARAIADMALARDEASPSRFIGMSRQIRREKARYYDILERTQKGDSDITPWLEWFLACYARGRTCRGGFRRRLTRLTVLEGTSAYRIHGTTEKSARATTRSLRGKRHREEVVRARQNLARFGNATFCNCSKSACSVKTGAAAKTRRTRC